MSKNLHKCTKTDIRLSVFSQHFFVYFTFKLITQAKIIFSIFLQGILRVILLMDISWIRIFDFCQKFNFWKISAKKLARLHESTTLWANLKSVLNGFGSQPPSLNRTLSFVGLMIEYTGGIKWQMCVSVFAFMVSVYVWLVQCQQFIVVLSRAMILRLNFNFHHQSQVKRLEL